MLAYSVNHTDHTLSGDDSGSFDHSVSSALVQDHIVMMGVVADLRYSCRGVPEIAGHTLGLFRNLCHVVVSHSSLQLGDTHSELVVVQRKLFIPLLEREILVHILGESPDAFHKRLASVGEPAALKLAVVTEHSQRSQLQSYEDDCVDDMIYDVASAQGLIS